MLKSEAETLLLWLSPAVLPSDSHQSPGREPQPEWASPSLWATICLASVTPFVFFYSYFHLLLNIPLRWDLLPLSPAKTQRWLPGWYVPASLLDPRGCSCITGILRPLSPPLSLSPPASFLGRQCPSSKPLPVKPVSTHQIKSQCWLTCAKQGCYLRKGKMRMSC